MPGHRWVGIGGCFRVCGDIQRHTSSVSIALKQLQYHSVHGDSMASLPPIRPAGKWLLGQAWAGTLIVMILHGDNCDDSGFETVPKLAGCS